MKLFSARRLHALRVQKGFTLIELLVVIGILGILAAALVATIDPFEQLNKATDASRQNTLSEFQTALLRYYSIRGTMPWSDATDHCLGLTPTTSIDGMYALNPTLSSCVTSLVTQGELKQAFTTATAALSAITLSASASNDVTMCYLPISKAKQKDPNTQFAPAGTTTTACKSQGGANNCYWCTR